MSASKSFIYKICVVGDGGVGKTSMVLRYTEDSFKENYIMTIGSNFSTKTVELPEFPQYNIKLQIWDLAGQKHFSFVRPPFYRGATGIIYVFDLTRRSSFSNLLNWKTEVEKVAEAISMMPRDALAIGKVSTLMSLEALGVRRGIASTLLHTMATNLRFEPDEMNFIRERSKQGTTKAIHKRDEAWEKKLK